MLLCSKYLEYSFCVDVGLCLEVVVSVIIGKSLDVNDGNIKVSRFF